ncbi:putative inorganic phosphate cotransporter isoform X2 [Diabrotica virgifera virgifera]|uniref:Inorganic phosphate cotransporter isoform X2 n=1 Tax=Diabrotica virgifera virgifera TaxID=50390 RepID=A0A6P7F5G6_DIAVI|nr:putative inorganic phosphate cotransporter isoform X2 [Diabrotica virgifera virgifera]
MVFKGTFFGVRHVQIFLLFWLCLMTYALRFNLSVAIVAMTQRTSVNTDVPYYNWTNQYIVLSAFFLGYIIPQIPSSLLARKWGIHRMMSITIVISAFMVILIPKMAEYFGAEGVMVCRVVQGLAQGFFYPLLSALMGRWVPIEERARVSAVTSAGATLGVILTYSLTGFLSKSSLGWPMSFYIFGVFGLVCSIAYIFIGSEGPSYCKNISKEERIYIEKSLGTENMTRNSKIPWIEILTSVPFWAITLTSLGQGWGTSTVMSMMPTYFDKVLKFDISSNGVLSSLPYINRFVCVFIWGISADYITKRKCLSLTNTRKLFTVIGSVGMGILLFLIGFLPETTNRYVVVVILIASEGFHVANSAGYNISHIDLSPNFAGTLMGLINFAEEIFSLITPLSVQYIVTDETDRHQWKIIITIGTCMMVAASAIFCLFSTAEKQPWNEIKSDDEKIKEEVNEKAV